MLPVGTPSSSRDDRVVPLAISLERTAHQDGEIARQQVIESAPDLGESMHHLIEQLGRRIHQAGQETEAAGEVLEEHRLIDTLKEEYRNT